MNNIEFEHYQRNIQAALKMRMPEQSEIGPYDRLLKGDVSGIQDFVYNIKSARASKTLKARSWFVKAISEHALQLVAREFSQTKTELLYNGGGNFYLFYNSFPGEQTAIEKVGTELNAGFATDAIQVTLSAVDLPAAALQDDFGAVWRRLQHQSAVDKLRQYRYYPEVLEQTFKPVSYGVWESLTKKLLEVRDFDQETSWLPEPGPVRIGENHVRMLGFNRQFNTRHDAADNIQGIPVWRNGDLLSHYSRRAREESPEDLPHPGGIIPFNYLARFAGARTGSEKIGILKLDVDNLGNTLNGMRNVHALRAVSSSIQWFFERYLMEDLLATRSFNWLSAAGTDEAPQQAAFKDNIYVIYAGGDDTFMVGAWDAVFEFARLLHQEWKKFTAGQLTISAGLLLADSHFPVVRFAELAQEALEEAKSGDKNKICVFGKPLYWDDFEFAREKALLLQQLILRKNEPRSIIERLQRSSDRFREILHKNADGNAEVPQLWTLLYSIRNTQNRGVLSELVQMYQQAIIYALKNKRKDLWNTEAIPVAIRWAEFLTRNKSDSEYE